MIVDKLCKSDLHLHTNLSCCAPKTTAVESYLSLCEAEGVELLGVSNHLYDWGGVDHTLQIKHEIDKLRNQTDIQFLVGCEAEIFYGKELYLTCEMAHNFDYVLLAPSHIFNFRDRYRDFDLSTPDKARKIMIENFKVACKLNFGMPTGFAHPLYPICAPWQQEVLDGISDETLRECYTLAAENNKSIEIHACVYRNTVELDDEGLSPIYIKMLRVAKECGCKFHFGSDAHEPSMFIGSHAKLERAAERAGITRDDLWEIVK